MLAAQQRQTGYYDQHHLNVEHDVGFQVLPSTKHLTRKVLSIGSNNLMPWCVGPVTMLKYIGPLTCCLKLPESMKVHSVWHVSYLKAYKSDGRRPPPPLPEMNDGDLQTEIDRILNHRTREHGRKQVTEYLMIIIKTCT